MVGWAVAALVMQGVDGPTASALVRAGERTEITFERDDRLHDLVSTLGPES